MSDDLRAGDVVTIGDTRGYRRVRVIATPDGRIICRNHFGSIAVRNVETNRLSYVRPDVLQRAKKREAASALAIRGQEQEHDDQARPVEPDVDRTLSIRASTDGDSL